MDCRETHEEALLGERPQCVDQGSGSGGRETQSDVRSSLSHVLADCFQEIKERRIKDKPRILAYSRSN